MNTALARKILAGSRDTARQVTVEFFERHPDWRERYGDQGFQRGVEDAEFHIRFLASALQAESPQDFRDYVAWARSVLASRGIDPVFLAENVQQVITALSQDLTPAERQLLEPYQNESQKVCFELLPPLAALGQTPFLEAILRGDRRVASTIVLEDLRAGVSLLEVYQGVIVASLARVGELWQANQLTVAQEHLATAVVQHVIAQAYHHFPPAPATARGHALVTGVQGEHHDVGGRLVADLWEWHGWDVRFLGTDLPLISILRALDEEPPRVLGISLTLPANLNQGLHLIEAVRQRWGPDEVAMLVGGRGFAAVTSTWCQDRGIQGRGSTLAEALELLKPYEATR